jgi:endonuclease YncB( thermonuclease family)
MDIRPRCCVLLVLLCLALLCSAAEAPPPPTLDTVGLIPVRVVDILDGSRISVEIQGQAVIVRLLGVAAPDANSPNTLLARNGKAARDSLTDLLQGEEVVLDPDPERPRNQRGTRWPEQDKDGILSAHLWRVSDGLLINSELIRSGSVYYNSNSTKRQQYIRWYSWCQRQARDSQLGVWSGEKLVASGTPPRSSGGLLPPAGGSMPEINIPGLRREGDLPATPEEIEFKGILDPAAVLPSGIKLDRASAKVVSQQRESWDFSWRAGIKSTSSRRTTVNVTVRFMDKDGYILAETVETGVSIPARSAVEARGTRNIPSDAARRVSSITLLIERAS